MAKTLEELPVYLKAQELWCAVSAILKNPRLIRNQRLWKQIDDANDSITANMEEGFEQPTDAAFANYLFTSKGSLKEVVARLRQAHLKGHITEADLKRCEILAEDLAPMLGGFIRYLYRSGFKDRGRYKLRQDKPPESDPKFDPGTQGDSKSSPSQQSDADADSDSSRPTP
jgi:four helix bundle protein